MAQSLQLLRTNPIEGEPPINCLDSPDTTIDDFTVTIEYMGGNTLDAKFHYPKDIEFQLNEYVVYEKEGEYAEGDPQATEKYYLLETPTWKKDEKSLMREYECKFLSKGEVLKNVVMLDSWEAVEDGESVSKPFLYQTEYSFYGGVEQYFLNIKSAMFNEFGYELDDDDVKQPKGWIMVLDLENDYPQVGDDQIITVSNMTVFDALKDIYTKFKVPFTVNNNIITVGGLKTVVDHFFRYGKGNGLYKINKLNFNDKIITKIRGVGSEKNLPYDYMKAEKAERNIPELPALPMSRLMPYVFRSTLGAATAIGDIKDYYVSDNFNPEFPNLSFETLDDIYPTIKEATHDNHRIDKFLGVYFNATGVSAENGFTVAGDNQQADYPNFWVKIPSLGFNLNDCRNEKEEMTLIPTNGQCGGCNFKVLSIGVAPDAWRGISLDSQSSVFSIPKLECDITVGGNIVVGYSNELFLSADDIIDVNVTGNVFLAMYHVAPTGSGEVRAATIVSIINKRTSVESVVNASYWIVETNGNSEYDVVNISEDFVVPSSDTYYVKVMLDSAVEVAEDISSGVRIVTNAGNIAVTRNVVQDVYDDTTNEEVWLLLQKDLETYSNLMPFPTAPMWDSYATPILWEAANQSTMVKPSGLVPKVGDEYILTGVSLPINYIISAEQRLENALKALLNENKDFKEKYDCGFDEKMLIENPDIVNDIKVGAVLKVYENTDPTETPNPANVKEVVINNLTLRYTPDKIIGGIS
jgi:hypothetical protein